MLNEYNRRSCMGFLIIVILSFFVWYQNPIYATHEPGEIARGFHGTSEWIISEWGVLEIYEGTLSFGQNPQWWYHRDQITSIMFMGEVIAFSNSVGLFSGLYNVEHMYHLERFDVSHVTIFQDMFSHMKHLKNLDLSHFNTDHAVNMKSMFEGLEHVSSLDLASFNTENVTNFSMMFKGMVALEVLDIASFESDNLHQATEMFANLDSLKDLNLGSFRFDHHVLMEDILIHTHNIKILRVGDSFHIGANSPFYLVDIHKSPMFDETVYTGFWRNVAGGCVDNPLGEYRFTSLDLMKHYETQWKADIFVWEKYIQEEDDAFDPDMDIEISPDQSEDVVDPPNDVEECYPPDDNESIKPPPIEIDPEAPPPISNQEEIPINDHESGLIPNDSVLPDAGLSEHYLFWVGVSSLLSGLMIIYKMLRDL